MGDDGAERRPGGGPKAGPAASSGSEYEYSLDESTGAGGRPLWPLEEQCTYAVVLSKRLKGEDGQAVVSPFPFVNHRDQTSDLQPIGDALEKVRQLTGYTFKRIDEDASGRGGRHMGLIAQEVQAVAPELVQIGAHGTLIIFVHPKDMGGMLVELMETPKGEHHA